MAEVNFTTQSEILHHGIKGQSWGIQNGPPYPLGSGISTGKRLKKNATGSKASSTSTKDMKKTVKEKRKEEVRQQKEDIYSQYLNNEISYSDMKTKVRDVYIDPKTRRKVSLAMKPYLELALTNVVGTGTKSLTEGAVKNIVTKKEKDKDKN